ncbi:radical SAM family heme chaperone HemW [Tuwongella immobilis]|uniref:radical SAM family heme chaperone HemW n=1 Tax=Tuwongella immobilis TaxID=692036 RepID=UPI001E4839AB|nr:radical SAM family heme chaperone HemW [Tuwongella immobilis]
MQVDPPWQTPRTAYVHIPFCAHHCGYCDFAVVTGQAHRQALYLEALEAELSASLRQPTPVAMRFLGGGTPTLLEPAQLLQLGQILDRWLPLRPDHQSVEFSIESTPDTLDADRVAALADIGVTRVSMGVQSFHAAALAALDRRHDAASIAPAIARVQARIPRLSIDLIYGIPGQSLADWQTDVQTALDLGVSHLSTYGLTYEKGTPLWKQRERGQVQPLDEDTELAQYEWAIDFLTAHGWDHYEMSNFAQPGQRCRHNEVYWANHAYFGFGVGAARYVAGKRELNTRSLADYLRKCLAGESPTFQSEELSPDERARETLAVQLRRCEGIHRESFHAQTGVPLDSLLPESHQPLVDAGFLAHTPTHFAITRQGRRLADWLVERLL